MPCLESLDNSTWTCTWSRICNDFYFSTIFPLVQQGCDHLRGYQVQNCHHSEARSLLPSALQETHTDTGRFVDTGRSELAQ